jgi:protease secretion system outer membrane protein
VTRIVPALHTALALALAVALPVAGAVDLPVAQRAALLADPALASALANRDAAQENIAIARSRLMPQVSLQSTMQQTNQTTDRGGLVQDFNGPSKNTQLSLRQAVYRRRDLAGLDIGKLQALYGEHKVTSAQSELWNRTALSWIDVLGAQALRDIYASTLSSVSQSAEQERKRFEAGDGTRDSVAEAAAQLALARAQLADTTIDLESKLRAFRLLTRLPVAGFDDFRLPGAIALGALPEAEDTLLDRILDTNAEVQQARVNEQIGERRLAQSSADHWPTLDLVAGMNRAQNDSTNTLGVRYSNSQVGVQLVVPIYSGGGVAASERQASAAYQAARSDTEYLIQRLRTLYLTDWRAQGSLLERAGAARELVEAGLEQRRAAEFGIKAGVRTWADRGSAELLRARRESDLVTLTATLLKTQARLLSLLPAGDPAWERWSQSLSQLARRPASGG